MESAHVDNVAERYRGFADNEVRGRNRVYSVWALGVATDPETCELVGDLPPYSRQPVLLFATARHLGAPEVADYSVLRDFLHHNWSAVRAFATTHSTQTNEAARCAVLLPFLAMLPGPLSLVEVGCSAGLCLYPDRYSYRLERDDGSVQSLGDSQPVIDCQLRGGIPAPTRLPTIAHRGGVDLNPMDPTDPEAVAWLRSLVWPDQPDRLERLDSALQIAAADPPQVLAGDLVDRVAEAVHACPTGTTPVVFHTAVLAYPEPQRRRQFVELMGELDCVWISVEGVTILPDIARQLPESLHRHRGLFVVSVNGHPLATAHGHGAWVRALDTD